MIRRYDCVEVPEVQDPIEHIMREKNKDMKTIIDLEKKIVKLENKIARVRSGCKKQHVIYEEKCEKKLSEKDKKIELLENRVNNLEKDLIRLDRINQMLKVDIDTVFEFIDDEETKKECYARINPDWWEKDE